MVLGEAGGNVAPAELNGTQRAARPKPFTTVTEGCPAGLSPPDGCPADRFWDRFWLGCCKNVGFPGRTVSDEKSRTDFGTDFGWVVAKTLVLYGSGRSWGQCGPSGTQRNSTGGKAETLHNSNRRLSGRAVPSGRLSGRQILGQILAGLLQKRWFSRTNRFGRKVPDRFWDSSCDTVS